MRTGAAVRVRPVQAAGRPRTGPAYGRAVRAVRADGVRGPSAYADREPCVAYGPRWRTGRTRAGPAPYGTGRPSPYAASRGRRQQGRTAVRGRTERQGAYGVVRPSAYGIAVRLGWFGPVRVQGRGVRRGCTPYGAGLRTGRTGWWRTDHSVRAVRVAYGGVRGSRTGCTGCTCRAVRGRGVRGRTVVGRTARGVRGDPYGVRTDQQICPPRLVI